SGFVREGRCRSDSGGTFLAFSSVSADASTKRIWIFGRRAWELLHFWPARAWLLGSLFGPARPPHCPAPRPRLEGPHGLLLWCRRLAERGQEHAVQLALQRSRRGAEFSVLHHRAERRHRTGARPAAREAARALFV